MQDQDNEKLLELIQQLESEIPSYKAENILYEVLKPLMVDAGYKMHHIDYRSDQNFDAIAQKNVLPDELPDSIGIEFKYFRKGEIGSDTVSHVMSRAIGNDISRIMLLTNRRFSFAARELIRHSSTPTKVELIDSDALRSWVGRLKKIPQVDNKIVEIIRTTMNRELIKAIVSDPRNLDQIEWRELEYLLREVFEGLGFEAILTPGSKDGGKDIILNCKISDKIKTYYVEVKHWRSGQKVGSRPIKDFLEIIINEEIDGGLFLSSSGYCSEAIESLTEIEKKCLRFGTDEKVVGLCKSYLKAKSGIWIPEPSFEIL